jgi:hypothetical protein
LDFLVTATSGQPHVNGWTGVVGTEPYWVVPSKLQYVSFDGAPGSGGFSLRRDHGLVLRLAEGFSGPRDMGCEWHRQRGTSADDQGVHGVISPCALADRSQITDNVVAYRAGQISFDDLCTFLANFPGQNRPAGGSMRGTGTAQITSPPALRW